MSRSTSGPPPSPSQPRHRPITDLLRGLLALLIMLALLVGIPVALWALRGNPLPNTGTDLSGLLDRLTAPDKDGSLFLGALTWLGWLAWASFALTVLLEALSQLRGLPTPHLPALRPQQRAASVLVAAAALLFTVPLLRATPALAVAPPATTAASVSAPLTTPTAAPTHEQTRPAPDTASPSRTYTVQPGDTLWRIATDHLGDGSRFTEIAHLNYGVAQTDGHALTAAHWLTPGWQLTLPGDAAPAAAAAEQTVVVEPGDTLWQIAQEHLGDGDRYPNIAAASTGLQDDGARLVDPNLIRPGWELTMPSSTAAPAPAVPDATPPAERPGVAPATAPERPAPAAPEMPPAAAAPAPPVTAPASPAAEMPTQAPAASAPAAATPTEPGSRTGRGWRPGERADRRGRRRADGRQPARAAGSEAQPAAQRRRRPGERIAMPPPDLQPVEFELRMVEDPTGLARVDQALRSLSVLLAELDQPLPALRVARLVDEDLELYLDGTTVLPAPFLATGDPTIWTLPADAPLLSVAELDQVAAPYPSLITLGHDLDDAHVLLDLEHAAALAVDGDPTASVAVLAAIAAELATSHWADDLQVTVVGCLAQLPDAIGTGRVRHVETLAQVLPALERRAATIREFMADSGLPDLQHARSAANQRPHSGAWYPEILLLGGPVDPTERTRLEDLLQDLPRVSLAAVTAADSTPAEWTLTLDPTDDGPDGVAVLRPLNFALRPQRLSAADLDQLLGLLAAADLPCQDLPREDPAAPVLIVEEPSLADLGAHLVSRTSIHLVLEPEPEPPAPKEPEATVADSTAAQVAVAPVEPRQADTVEAFGEPARPVEPGGEPAPLVQVLGPVTVLHARGRLEPDRRNQLTEIAAFIALHPGLDHTHLDEAKWPGARNLTNTRNSAVSKLRRWLGTAADGTEHLPDAAAGYRLHPDVRSDWHLWLELLPNGPAGASTEALADALGLVKGQPFAGVNKRTYAWSERGKQEMISAIGDAAHELARRALLAGDATLARQAAAAGLQADPGAELLWRDALRAEWLAGDLAGLNSTADRLIDLASKLGDDLEPETDSLLEELLSRATPRAGTR